MYFVGGITGQTGSAAANALLRSGYSVRAMVRDAGRAADWRIRGVELLEGNLNDVDALARAFDGTDGAYAMVPPDVQHADPLGYYEDMALVFSDAARRSGLERLVFLSSEGAQLTEGSGPIRGAHLAEGILQGSTANTVFLRPSFFQENWKPLFGLAAAQGILPSFLQPLTLTKKQVATRDIGEAVAALLIDEKPPAVVGLTGPEGCSALDVAEAMATVLRRDVVPVPVPRESWGETLSGSGVGKAYADLICEMYDGINAGHIQASGDVETRIGPTTVLETVRTWK